MENWVLEVIEYAIRILVVIAGTYGIGLIRKYNLGKWVVIGVKAAEQIFRESGLGAEKKQYVIDFIKNKFKVSDEQLDKLIEAAVYEINRLQGKF